MHSGVLGGRGSLHVSRRGAVEGRGSGRGNDGLGGRGWADEERTNHCPEHRRLRPIDVRPDPSWVQAVVTDRPAAVPEERVRRADLCKLRLRIQAFVWRTDGGDLGRVDHSVRAGVPMHDRTAGPGA